MSKIILVTAIMVAFEKAVTLEAVKSVASQAIETLKVYEANESEKQTLIIQLNAEALARDQEIVVVQAELTTANEELEASNEIVAELSAKLNKAEENRGNPNLQVTVDKKDYQIVGNKFQTVNGEYSAEDLAKDETLLKEMIAKGSGAILPL